MDQQRFHVFKPPFSKVINPEAGDREGIPSLLRKKSGALSVSRSKAKGRTHGMPKGAIVPSEALTGITARCALSDAVLPDIER
jgi:hypothetical protein